MESRITTCINTNNNLEYLKLAVKSVRQNAFYSNQPIVIYAENCTDGTNEWLAEVGSALNLSYYIEENEVPVGIGGGMDFCVSKAETEFVNIIHSDMWIAPNQDLELLNLYKDVEPSEKLIASSFRIQPKIFPGDLIIDLVQYFLTQRTLELFIMISSLIYLMNGQWSSLRIIIL